MAEWMTANDERGCINLTHHFLYLPHPYPFSCRYAGKSTVVSAIGIALAGETKVSWLRDLAKFSFISKTASSCELMAVLTISIFLFAKFSSHLPERWSFR